MNNSNKEYTIEAKRKLSLGLSELWEYKELFYFFTWRDIKVKYKQTVLGFGWAVLQPLLLMAIMTFFIGDLMGMADRTGGIPYPIFVFSGLMFWGIFQSGVSGAGNSMVVNARIIKKIYFPRMIIPISSILVAVFDFVMAFAIFLLICVYYGVTGIFVIDPLKILWVVPTCLILTILATMGVGTLIAALNVKYRDFRYVIPFMIQILFFVTPVIYSSDLITDINVKYIISLNPMFAPISLIKYGLMESTIEWKYFLISLTSLTFWLLVGILYFKKTEDYFADIA